MLPTTVGKMIYPPVYVLSQIPNLVEIVKRSLPRETEVKALKLPDEFNKNTCLSAEQEELIKVAEVVLVDCWILAKYHSKMLKLKWAHSSWAGIEPLMAAVNVEKSVPSFLLTHHGGTHFASVMAEYVVCQILNVEREMMFSWSCQQQKTWGRPDRFSTFRSLDDLTVGMLGVGNMGCGIAQFLKSRGSKVLGFSRSPRAPGSKEFAFFDSISTNLAEILPLCDYVCNTLPSTKDTKGLLDLSAVKLCSKKPVFINVGRGNVIKEEVLVQALREAWFSGAVLDVFEEEPLPPSSELWDIPTVFITPHVAAVSKPEHVAEEFVKNYNRFIAGEELNYVVKWSSGY